jgi:hypothetical protein
VPIAGRVASLDRNEAKSPKLVGKAAVNSDDDVVCDFIGPDGNYRRAALIAPLRDLNVRIDKLIEVSALNPRRPPHCGWRLRAGSKPG